MTTLRHRWLMLVLGPIVALALSGCITVGQEFRAEAVDLIKPGQTTDDEVLKMLGNPVRTGVNDSGNREWTYAHYRASFGSFKGRDLVVTFDDAGKVKSYSYHTTDPNEPRVKAR